MTTLLLVDDRFRSFQCTDCLEQKKLHRRLGRILGSNPNVLGLLRITWGREPGKRFLRMSSLIQTSNVGLFPTEYLFYWLLLFYSSTRYILRRYSKSIELATFAEYYQNEIPREEKCKLKNCIDVGCINVEIRSGE